jgi:hypothetical protein
LRLVRSLVFEEEVDFEVFNDESSTVRVVDGLEELVGYCNFLPSRCFSGPSECILHSSTGDVGTAHWFAPSYGRSQRTLP